MSRGGTGGRGGTYSQYLMALGKSPQNGEGFTTWTSFCKVRKSSLCYILPKQPSVGKYTTGGTCGDGINLAAPLPVCPLPAGGDWHERFAATHLACNAGTPLPGCQGESPAQVLRVSVTASHLPLSGPRLLCRATWVHLSLKRIELQTETHLFC